MCSICTHLSTVATSQQNEDSSRGDGGTQLPLVLAEGLLPMALQFTRNIFRGVVTGLQQKKHTLIFAARIHWKTRRCKNTIKCVYNHYIVLNENHNEKWNITHHLAQFNNTGASILVSSNSLNDCCLGLLLNLFLHLKQEQIIINPTQGINVMCICLLW